MPVLANNSVVLMTLRGKLCGQRIINVFGWQFTGVTPGTQQVDAFDALHTRLKVITDIIPKFLAICPPNYLLEQTWFQVVHPVRYAPFRYVETANGTNDYTASTANTALTITRRGDVADRQSISSLHIPCAAVEDSTNVQGEWNGGIINAANALCDLIKGSVYSLGMATADGIIPSPQNYALPRVITQAFPQFEVRVMRRRTVRLGE